MILSRIVIPSFTIKFKICAQQRICSNEPFNIRVSAGNLSSIVPNRFSINLSLVLQLSSVIVDSLLSKFQSARTS
ncbi:Os10g0443600 [Oryza sativa Japonica Group]|uniref:Os02g0238150 protein n=1 Tax=Oryza sativa subsp. japonica TaxID=39947 RepID=A0A0P0VGX8_ORYSJ|nr:hypothetical protein EE612_010024 [Oryza sativa]KAB8112816.1 hypothetical protein EE612_051552 [Oryza sativa]BAS77829.1 Os02g0238150 [Oryza sativa Japonica Group]BAS78953.1 Os02g0521432 [Oryza sativa Japonica Group]BAT11054.1 Os10g0443600 [Oryza sativa Japonica Group]